MTEAATTRAERRRAKGSETRARIKQAALRALDRTSYNGLTIAMIAEEAGVAHGLFYHYFANARALIDELVEEQIARFEAAREIEEQAEAKSWFEHLRAHFEMAVACYAERPGLMRCIKQLCIDDPQFRERWRQSFRFRLNRLVKRLPSLVAPTELDARQIAIVANGLSSVGLNLLEACYIEKDPEIIALDLDPEEMAEWLALLFHRGLFAANPPACDLRYAGRILAIGRA